MFLSPHLYHSIYSRLLIRPFAPSVSKLVFYFLSLSVVYWLVTHPFSWYFFHFALSLQTSCSPSCPLLRCSCNPIQVLFRVPACSYHPSRMCHLVPSRYCFWLLEVYNSPYFISYFVSIMVSHAYLLTGCPSTYKERLVSSDLSYILSTFALSTASMNQLHYFLHVVLSTH